MKPAHSHLVVVSALGLAAVRLAGCATHQGITRVGDGTYHVDCRGELGQCLAPLEAACARSGYDIVGSERRQYSGPPPEGFESITTSATVRCREPKPLFGADPNPPLPALSGAPSATAPPLRPAPASSTRPAVTAPPPAAPATSGGATAP